MERKLPTPDPQRHIGRWAVTLNHRLFLIESVHKDEWGAPVYVGSGLDGEPRRSGVPTLLDREDSDQLNDQYWRIT